MQYSIPPTQMYLLHTTADLINSQDVDPQLMANRRPTASISQLVAGIPSFAIPITSDEIHDHSEEYSSVISLIEFKPIPLQYVSCFVTPSFHVGCFFNPLLMIFNSHFGQLYKATILPHSVPAISRDQWLHVCRPTPSSAIRCSSTPPSPAERQWATQGGAP